MEHVQPVLPEISFNHYFEQKFPQYFDSTNTADFYPNAYTPSYGSPQETIYDSHDSSPSFSDCDPSDGYSSSGSSGFPSPQMTADMLPADSHASYGGVEEHFDHALSLQQQQQQFEFNAFLKGDNTSMMPSLKLEDQPRENLFSGLKLNTNVPLTATLGQHMAGSGNNYLSVGSSLPPISPNTMAQCLEAAAGVDGPLINLLPATPVSPNKAAAQLFNFDAKSLLFQQHQMQIHQNGMIKQEPIPAASDGNLSDHSQHSTASDLWRRKSLDHNVLRTRTPSPISHSDTTSRRRSVPVDMAQHLHTMNLSPPKPVRKSKYSAPFACPYDDCPKTFTRQYNLKSHLRTHTDERPFICGHEGCPRAFARQHDRKRHYNLHLGFKPHVCGHCGRAFARLDALNRHLRSDNGALCAQATLPGGGAKKFKPVRM